MPASALAPHQLRLTIDPATLGFASTAELQDLPLPWIGQERAQAAAQFGLGLHQPDYHLFVLGEVGSGRASLLRQAMQTAAAERAVPRERRAEIDAAEHELRTEIARFLEAVRPLERTRDDALAALRRQTIKPLVEHALHDIRQGLRKQIKDTVKLTHWLDQVEQAVLGDIDLFEPLDAERGSDQGADAEDDRKDALDDLLARCQVNLVVDNHGRTAAPVVVEDNPTQRTLFGSIEHGSDADTVQADHTNIHAGSLLKAHGGFILLHLHDLAAEEGLWQRLRRFLRCGRLQIEEGGGGPGHAPGGAVALQPEPVDVDVKIVLIGSVDEYYALQDADPDAARRFRVQVEFSDHFAATSATHHATAILVCQVCKKRGLPHFGP